MQDVRRTNGSLTNIGQMSNERKSDEHPTEVRLTLDESSMNVGRKWDGRSTEVKRTSNGSQTDVQQNFDENRTCRTQSPLLRWWAIMQHYNVGRPRAATRGVAAVLANHMLQLAAFLRPHSADAAS